MMRAVRFVSCVVVVVALSIGAFAQANEIALTGGGDFVSNQNVSVGRSWGIEGSLAHRLFGAPMIGLYAEIPIAAAFNSTPKTTCTFPPTTSCFAQPFNYTSIFATPGLKLRIGGPGMAPYVAVGGGIGHFSASASQGSTTTGTISYGAGVDIPLIHFFALRAEARDYNSGYPALGFAKGTGRQHNLFVSGGVVVRF